MIKLEKRLLYIALLLALLLVAFYQFGDIINHIFWEKEDYIDISTFDFLDDYINPHLTPVIIAISFIGSGYFLIPAYLVLIFWLIKRGNGHIAFYAATIGATSSLLVYFLKELFQRGRPEHPIGMTRAFTHSFPSGHTTAAFIFFGLIIYLIVWLKIILESCPRKENKSGLLLFSSVFTILFASFYINALFYPWILYWIISLLADFTADNKDSTQLHFYSGRDQCRQF